MTTTHRAVAEVQARIELTAEGRSYGLDRAAADEYADSMLASGYGRSRVAQLAVRLAWADLRAELLRRIRRGA